jgi:hypothetical protein
MTLPNPKPYEPGNAATDAWPDLMGHWVEIRSEPCRGGRTLHTLVNQRTHAAIELDDRDLRADGRLDPDLIEDLRRNGFLAGSDPDHTGRSTGARTRLGHFLRTLDVSWTSADRFVRLLHRAGGRHAFRPAAVAAQFVLALAGVAATVAILATPVELSVDAHLVPVFFALGIVAVAGHELAHAVVVTHYGRSVDAIGFRIHLATPAFYVESSDALLLTRRQRIIQAAAGPWVEWLLTSVVAVLVVVLPDAAGGWESVLRRFVALNLVNVVSNLLPFVGLDGCLLFADGIRVPDLPRRARGAVGRLLTRVTSGERPTRHDVGLAAYATANAVVAIGLVALSMILWIEMFADLITTLYRTGPVGVVTLGFAAAVLLRPALVVVLPRLAEMLGTVERALHQIRFRKSITWRCAATAQLRQVDERIANMTAQQLGLLAGLLQPVPRDHGPDSDQWLVVEVGPQTGIAQPVRAALRRLDLLDVERMRPASA